MTAARRHFAVQHQELVLMSSGTAFDVWRESCAKCERPGRSDPAGALDAISTGSLGLHKKGSLQTPSCTAPGALQGGLTQCLTRQRAPATPMQEARP